MPETAQIPTNTDGQAGVLVGSTKIHCDRCRVDFRNALTYAAHVTTCKPFYETKAGKRERKK